MFPRMPPTCARLTSELRERVCVFLSWRRARRESAKGSGAPWRGPGNAHRPRRPLCVAGPRPQARSSPIAMGGRAGPMSPLAGTDRATHQPALERMCWALATRRCVLGGRRRPPPSRRVRCSCSDGAVQAHGTLCSARSASGARPLSLNARARPLSSSASRALRVAGPPPRWPPRPTRSEHARVACSAHGRPGAHMAWRRVGGDVQRELDVRTARPNWGA